MVLDRKNLSSVLVSATQKSTSFAKIFKSVFNRCKNTGLCILWTSNYKGINAQYITVVYNFLSMVRKDEFLGL
jgi:hypothetical protein